MKKYLKILLNKIKNIFKTYDRINRTSAVSRLEWEVHELENILGLILFGFLVGIPSAPIHITLELLPYMEEELDMLFEKIDTSNEPIAELFSMLDIG